MYYTIYRSREEIEADKLYKESYMSDQQAPKKVSGKPDMNTSTHPIQGKLNGILIDSFGSHIKCDHWPPSKEYIKNLGDSMEKELFNAWKQGKADERDAKFFSVLPRVLELGEEMVVDVFLDARPKHRNRTTKE